MLKYTSPQTLSVVGIPPATLRYWRPLLAPISSYKAYGPCFTRGDLLALKVVKVLTRDFNIGIQSIGPTADALFKECNRPIWPTKNPGWFAYQPEMCVIQIIDTNHLFHMRAAVILVPIQPLLDELDEVLLSGASGRQQAELPLAPVALARRQ